MMSVSEMVEINIIWFNENNNNIDWSILINDEPSADLLYKDIEKVPFEFIIQYAEMEHNVDRVIDLVENANIKNITKKALIEGLSLNPKAKDWIIANYSKIEMQKVIFNHIYAFEIVNTLMDKLNDDEIKDHIIYKYHEPYYPIWFLDLLVSKAHISLSIHLSRICYNFTNYSNAWTYHLRLLAHQSHDYITRLIMREMKYKVKKELNEEVIAYLMSPTQIHKYLKDNDVETLDDYMN